MTVQNIIYHIHTHKVYFRESIGTIQTFKVQRKVYRLSENYFHYMILFLSHKSNNVFNNASTFSLKDFK